MAIELTKFHMPVKFEKKEILEDTRFQKIKIWIAHTGENLNNTYFTKELLEEMVHTLPYVPIVGFIEKNENNEDDFSDHRSSIVVEKNKIKFRYEGHAYGFIPEEPNAKFEIRGGKEWLTAEGFLWTKFSQSIEILEESNGKKSQSMEIQDVDGQVDDLGRVVFSQGRFSALCILGEDVSPAMTGSTIEFFSVAKESIREMIHEFSLQKGDLELPDKVKKKKIDNEVEETEKIPEEPLEPSTPTEPSEPVKEPVTEPEPEPEPEPETEPEVVSEEEVASEENSESSDESTEENASESEETEEFSKLEQFELSHDSVRKNLQQSIRTKYSEDFISVYVLEVFDDYFYSEFYDWENDSVRYVKTNYSRNEDNIILDGEEEVFAMFVNGGEKSEIENNRKKVSELELAIKELQDYKDSIEHSAKEELLESYSSILDSQDLKNIRDKFAELSVDEIEKEIAYSHFQKTKNTDEFSGLGARTLSLGATKDTGRYGSLSEYFGK